MSKFLFKIVTKLKEEIKDPQGEVVEKISKRLKIFDEIKVQAGKFYGITVVAKNLAEAQQKAGELAKNVLSNPVVETYEIICFEEIWWKNLQLV